MSVDKVGIIAQICNNSGLEGEALEALRQRLEQQSREELEAELINNLLTSEGNSQKGLGVEHNESSVIIENHEKAEYFDEKGRFVTEYKDGDNVLEKVIKKADSNGNVIEERITYILGRPSTKVVTENGKEISKSRYNYIKRQTKDNKEVYTVNIETENSDNTKTSTHVLMTDTEGNYPSVFVLSRQTTDKDGNITQVFPLTDSLVEVKISSNGERITTVYDTLSLENYADGKRLYQRLQNENEQVELLYDGKGNTYTTVNAGDGWEKLANRFHTTVDELKKLNPKIKNLKAGQDILVPGEHDVNSKEIDKVQSRQEAMAKAHNAEIDRRIGSIVSEGLDAKYQAELKSLNFKPTAENYGFYKQFSKLDDKTKNNVISAIKYYRNTEHITDNTKIKEKIMEHLDVNLFDSGKSIKISDEMSTPYALRKKDVSLETFLTKICNLDIKKEPAKTVYERLSSLSQEELNKIKGNRFTDMSNLKNYHDIAARFETFGIDIRTRKEHQMDVSAKQHQERVLGDGVISRGQTVDFAIKQVQAARKTLEKHLADLKDNMLKNAGEIIIEDFRFWGVEMNPINNPASKVLSSLARKLGFKKGTIEGFTKSIETKINELREKEHALQGLKGTEGSRDFARRYAEITGGSYEPFGVEKLQELCKNPPKQGTKEYEVYEQKVNTAIEDMLGENFTQEVSNYISTSTELGSAVEMAMLCYATMGMGNTLTIGGKTLTGATALGRTAIGASHLGGYAAVRTSINFLDDIDNVIDGSKTIGGVLVGENNADVIRQGAAVIKEWATGKITREEVDEKLSKIGELTFDDFVSSTGGQFVVNTVTSTVFGGAAGAASPLFAKAGQIGTSIGQKLGISAPQLSEVTSKIISSNANGINGAEFMAEVYAAMSKTNIAGKGLQFAVETAVFYATNLPLSLIQEKLSESNNEMELAYKEGRLTEYLLNRFKDEAINLFTVQSIGMIVAMMTGANPAVNGLTEKFSEYETLKNTTIRYENIDGKNVVTVEGTTGKLFLDGDLIKYYSKSGELVQSEPVSDVEAFKALDAGTKAFYLLNRFMMFENYMNAQTLPVVAPPSEEADAKEIKDNISELQEQKAEQPAVKPERPVVNPEQQTPIQPEPVTTPKVEDMTKTEPETQVQMSASTLENMPTEDRIAKCKELLQNGVELNGRTKAVFLEDGSLLTAYTNGLYQIEIPDDNVKGYSRMVKFDAKGGMDITDVQKNDDGTYTVKEEKYRNGELRNSSTQITYHDNILSEKSISNSGNTEDTSSLFKEGRSVGEVHKLDGKPISGGEHDGAISQSIYYLHNENLQRTSLREFEYSDGTKDSEEIYREHGEDVRIVIKRDGTATINGEPVTLEEAQNKSRARVILDGATKNAPIEEGQPLPDGFVKDKTTSKPIKVDVNKIQINIDKHDNGGLVTITDEFGNELGHAMYEIRRGELYGFGLASKVSGIGIGTRLTLERAKIAKELGLDFVIDAQAGDYAGMSHNKFPTNLKYHYQSGFRAYDEGVNKLIEEAIEKGYKIPVSINQNVPMRFEGSIEELENRINSKKSASTPQTETPKQNEPKQEEITDEDIKQSEAEFLDMLEDNSRAKYEHLMNTDENYKNATNEDKMKMLFGLYNQAKLYGCFKDNYVPEFETVKQKSELVEDAKIKSYLDNELENLSKLSEAERTAKLLELEYLADAINNFGDKYSMLHSQSSGFDNPAAQSHRVLSIFAKNNAKFNLKPEYNDKIDEHIKYDGIKNYVTKYSKSNPEMTKYVYSLYLEKQSPEIKAKCEEIEQITGTKVFVDNTDPELMQHLNDTQKELTLWKNADLNVPTILDEFDADATYLVTEFVSTINKNKTIFAGYTEKEDKRISISANNTKGNRTKYTETIRHELTHLNDPNFEVALWDKNNPIHNELLSNREKYVQYLKDAGASEQAIEYAFSMPREFSAVAMQLDTSKYPEEFKTLLIKMGVPEKAFEFEPIKAETPAEQTSSANISQQVMDKVKELNAKWYPIENTRLTEQEKQELINDSINMIIKQVSQGIEGNSDLIMERLEKLDKNRGYGFTYILSGRCKNSGFLIDNIEVINEKILTRNNSLAMGADIFDFLDNLNENNLPKAIQMASAPDFIKNIKAFIYDAKPHKIELGEKTVEVDSSDVIAIVSGIQSLSYFRDGNSNSFENTAKTLVELDNPDNAQQYYYQIVEGILVQRPELVEIADDLREYIDRQKIINPNKDMSEIQQEFFDELEKTGKLPKTITLRTVVPDENALLEPQATFNLFKQGLTEGAKSLAQIGHSAEKPNTPTDNNGHIKPQINSLDDFINEIYALVSQGSEEPIKEEDIAEFKKDAEKNGFYDKYKKYQEFFDEFLSKNSEGKYFWGNESRYDQLYKIVNKCLDDEFENPQEALEQFNELALQYIFTEAYAKDKNADYRQFGITEKRADLIKKMVDDTNNPLDDYDVNNIVEYVSGVKSDADIDYMLSLDMPTKQAANIAAKITTQSERDNFAMISNGTFDKNNNENRLGNDLMISLAKIMEVPGGRERIENILKIEDFRKRIDLLKGYDRYSLNPEHTSYFNKITKYKLFEYDKLTPYDIEHLAYMEEEHLDVAVKRGLFTNPDIKGENISNMARWSDEQFDVYNKLKTEMSFDEDNAYYAAQSIYGLPEYFEKYDLANLPQIKTKDELYDFIHYMNDTDREKLLSRPEIRRATRLDYKAVKNLLTIDDEHWPRVTRRGLLENPELSKTGSQVAVLSSLDEETYQAVLSRGFADRTTRKELGWIKYMQANLSDEEINKYFELRDNPPVDPNQRSIDTEDLIKLAQLDRTVYDKVVQFLYMEDRKSYFSQFKVDELQKLFENYPDEDSFEKFKELVDMQILKDQGTNQLDFKEINKLLELYNNGKTNPDEMKKFDDVMELITNDGRNRNKNRLTVDAASYIIYNRHTYTENRNPETGAWTRTEINKTDLSNRLVYIPERGIEQYNYNDITGIMSAINSVEDLEKYNDFMYSAKRKENSCKQLTGTDLMTISSIKDNETLQVAKDLIYVEKRGMNQFNGREIVALAQLTPEERAQAEKYYHIPNRSQQFSGQMLAIIGKYTPEQLERLDKLLSLENGDATNEDVLIQLCKTDEMPMNDVAESTLVGDVMVISNKPKYIYNHVVELKEKFPACTIFSALNIVEEATKQENHQKFLENATKILEHNTNVSHLFVARVAKLSDEKIQRVFDYIESGVDNDFAIVYGECDDVNIKEHYEQAISDAKIKRNQLKSGREDLTDNKILNFFSDNKYNIIKTIDMLGLSTFEYAYTSKLDGVKRLADAVHKISVNFSKENYELLKQRLADKSLEPQEKISKLRAIAGLINHCTEEEIHSYIELIRPNKPTKDELKTAREIWANPKARFDDKFNTFCETFGIEKDNQKVIDFFNKRATVNGKGYKILNNVKESDIAKLLEVEVLRKRNLTEWNDAIDKKIFSTIGVPYSPELSAKLKLTDNRYLSEILSSNDGFRDNFGELVDELIAKPDKTIAEVFNEMPQNIETKRQYDILGIPYDRFTTADKNSYKTVKVSTDAEKTKQDALRNLEADFNDEAFKALPKEETQKIFDALEKELGIKALTKQEPVYDIDGFIIGKKDVTHFFIGEKQIDFSHLEKMISVIKKTINENEFWTKTASDPTVEESKTTIYNHLTKLRDGEIHNASKMKANEETEIEVHQTDMNNLSHSLFLGNHGACCTAVGTGCNQYAAPRYCMDKCISAIEVMDGKEFVGNTMCYFAFVDGELSFVMDNIELNGKYQFNDSIRDTFMEYAKQLCSEMGLPDIPIYAGPYRHKFNMDPYEFSGHKITIIGSTNGDPTYIDFVTGRYVIDGEKVNDIEMYRIR